MRLKETIDKFENDIKLLKAAGYSPIFFSDLYRYLDAGKKLPDRPIMITFDDGYLSNYEIAYPILKRNGMKADMFVIGWCVGIGEIPGGRSSMLPHFRWDDAREMEASGYVEIESHTYNLHNSPEDSDQARKSGARGILKHGDEDVSGYAARISDDFNKAVGEIKSNLGDRPVAISYPFGAFSLSGQTVARKIYSGSFTSEKGVRIFKNASDLYDIPRIPVMEHISVLDEIEKSDIIEPTFSWLFKIGE